MTTMYDILRHSCKLKKVSGDYGVEIETEVLDPSKYPEGFLKLHETINGVRYEVPILEFEGHVDNSLRNFGMEFVFKKPLDFDNSLKALDNFGKKTVDIPFMKGTPSTSVHVHVNMLNMTPLEMANFVTIYVACENILVELSGESRRSNLFALPIRVARGVVDNIVKLFQTLESRRFSTASFNQSYVKYAALNIGRLASLGTLEIRSFRGETDPEILKKWLTLIDDIKIFSKTEGLTPRDILSSIESGGCHEFLSEVFPRSIEWIRSDVVEYEFLFYKNLLPTAVVATSIKDWTKFNDDCTHRKEEEEVVLKKKMKSSLLDIHYGSVITDELDGEDEPLAFEEDDSES